MSAYCDSQKKKKKKKKVPKVGLAVEKSAMSYRFIGFIPTLHESARHVRLSASSCERNSTCAQGSQITANCWVL